MIARRRLGTGRAYAPPAPPDSAVYSMRRKLQRANVSSSKRPTRNNGKNSGA